MNPHECFLSIAILSGSSQTRFAVNEFVVNEFSGVFFTFFNGFFCLSEKVKEVLLISGIFPNLSFLGPNR